MVIATEPVPVGTEFLPGHDLSGQASARSRPVTGELQRLAEEQSKCGLCTKGKTTHTCRQDAEAYKVKMNK